jgi:hypothetical protein
MATRSKSWTLTAGEKVPLGKSLSDDLDAGVTLTGTPTITIHEKTGGQNSETWDDVTADFTIANEQVNVAEFTDANGKVVAIGKGVVFELTASDDPGRYEVRISCAATDGTEPAATPPVPLHVVGPPAPAAP